MNEKKYKAFLNEQDLPDFNDFEKEVLQYGLDNIENLEAGAVYPNDVANDLYNSSETVIYHHDGIELISKFQGDEGTGWAAALEYLFRMASDMGTVDNLLEAIAEGNWAKVASILLLFKGEELLNGSEIIAQAVASDEELTDEDIENIEQELELFIS